MRTSFHRNFHIAGALLACAATLGPLTPAAGAQALERRTRVLQDEITALRAELAALRSELAAARR